MTSKSPEPKRERRKLKDLKTFPTQSDFFDALSDHDLKALASDIKRNGLHNLIEILPKNTAGYPPNTIVAGHMRTRALLLNGETETETLVRHDLADANRTKIEKVFLEDNQNRRQLDTLSKARVALRLYEIERKRPRGQLCQFEEGEARDRVGKAIGMSGRNLCRYFRVLKTPREVQDAFRAEKLPLVVAEKVADLDKRRQAEVAEDLRKLQADLIARKREYDAEMKKHEHRNMTDAQRKELLRKAGLDEQSQNAQFKQVVSDFLPTHGSHIKSTKEVAARFLRGLHRGVAELKGRIEAVDPGLVAQHLADLKAARDVIKKLLEKVKG